MTFITHEQLFERAKQRPEGYVQEVVERAAKVEPGGVWLDDAVLDQLRLKYAAWEEALPEVTGADMLSNAAASVLAWAKAGFPVATRSARWQRKEVCDSCPEWDQEARAGLGKCRACGCTRFKRWLATSRCPLNKWPA